MGVETKLTLSDNELSLVKNTGWILTKQVIIDKVFALFSDSVPAIKSTIVDLQGMPTVPANSVPKIFKGENYMQLPYVIMDYPRCFEKEDIFAIRTMFWWGNFFSVTLHLSGQYKSVGKDIFFMKDSPGMDGLYVGVNEDQWQHHFDEGNFIPFRQLTLPDRIDHFKEKNFVKLALKFSLDEWEEMPQLLAAGYKRIASMLNLAT